MSVIVGGTNLISSITGGVFLTGLADPDIGSETSELEQAIYSAFMNNAILVAAAPGGLHNVQAQSGTSYPYVVFELPTGLKSNSFSHEKETVLIQFKIFTKTNSSVSLNELRGNLINVFDNNLLILASYDTISMRRTVSVKTKDELDEKVWIYMVSYRIELEKK